MLMPGSHPQIFQFNWPGWEIQAYSCNKEKMSPALETCLGLITYHQWIPGKNVCLAAVTSEQWVIPSGLGVLSQLLGCCPHQRLRAPWNSLLNLAKQYIMLVFTLLNPWQIIEHFNTLPLLPDSQVPHEVPADWIRTEDSPLFVTQHRRVLLTCNHVNERFSCEPVQPRF